MQHGEAEVLQGMWLTQGLDMGSLPRHRGLPVEALPLFPPLPNSSFLTSPFLFLSRVLSRWLLAFNMSDPNSQVSEQSSNPSEA